ncbi:MAG: hypothetical protein QMD30_00670 [Methanothermobacter wolfeii]|nr:hypothetical protein [Methanothermobacter wolfeii]
MKVEMRRRIQNRNLMEFPVERTGLKEMTLTVDSGNSYGGSMVLEA